MIYWIGVITGWFFGVYLFTIFINFLIKRKTKQDSVRQRVIALFFSIAAYIVISTWITKTNEDIFKLLGWIGVTILCGVVIASFYALRLNIKQFCFVLLYGGMFWFLLSSISGIAIRGLQASFLGVPINPTDEMYSIVGLAVLGITFPVVLFIIYKQKLPWTKNTDNQKKSQKEANGSL